ncbi:MAG: hypothetical protein IKX57_03390 [Oscillospiraceae bacterium]|nr:hypothetical protein [Oscillospiraceae bacterium]
MKKIGLQMSVLMGITLSFFLALTGNLRSGHFTLPAFLISFLLSTVISLLIGLFVPMPKLEGAVCEKLQAEPRSMKGNAVTALVSDLIYTPVITLVMTLLGYRQAVQHGASVSFGGMFLVSLLVSLVLGYVLIFVLKPLFLKLVLKANGMDPSNMQGGPKE